MVRGAVAALLVWQATAQASVRATVDRDTVALGDSLTLQVEVEGMRAATPRLPELPDFDVQSSGTSTRMQIVNGAQSSSVTYQYALVARRAGTLTIGPIVVGRERTAPITVRVEELEPGANASEDLFIEATVSRSQAYVNQQITYTFRFLRRVRLVDANASLPSFDGFLVQSLGEQREYQTRRGGRDYLVTEISRALFPQRAGTLTIAPASVQASVQVRGGDPFSGFFSRSRGRTERVVGPTQTIVVQALPAPPAGFSGLVGRFTLESSVSRTEVPVGESVTVDVTLRGVGNVTQMPELELNVPEGLKAYPEKPESNTRVDDARLTGTKSARVSVVPSSPGEHVIPPVLVVYFDTQRREYVTLRTEPAMLTATGSAAVADAPSGDEPLLRRRVEVRGDDVFPLRTNPEGWRRAPWPNWLLWPLWGLGPVAYGLLVLWLRRRAGLDGTRARRKQALEQLARALEGAQSLSANEADVLLRRFLGDRLGLAGTALTPEELEQALSRAGAQGAMREEVSQELRTLEAARFGGAAHTIDPGRLLTLARRWENAL